jgi:hypothetical protein
MRIPNFGGPSRKTPQIDPRVVYRSGSAAATKVDVRE